MARWICTRLSGPYVASTLIPYTCTCNWKFGNELNLAVRWIDQPIAVIIKLYLYLYARRRWGIAKQIGSYGLGLSCEIYHSLESHCYYVLIFLHSFLLFFFQWRIISRRWLDFEYPWNDDAFVGHCCFNSIIVLLLDQLVPLPLINNAKFGVWLAVIYQI